MPDCAPRSPSSKASPSQSSRRRETDSATAKPRLAARHRSPAARQRSRALPSPARPFPACLFHAREKLRQLRAPPARIASSRGSAANARDALTHQLDIVPSLRPGCRRDLVIHPVNLAIQQHRMIQLGNLAVKPQMHAADAASAHAARSAAASASAPSAGGICGNNFAVASNGSASTRKSDSQLARARRQRPLRSLFVPLRALHMRVQDARSPPRSCEKWRHARVQLAQRNACSFPCCPPPPNSETARGSPWPHTAARSNQSPH